jgi:broad specificity phosphatase PhoE
MSEILLLRHGQASFGSEDYDALSKLGQQQAAIVADYLRRSNTLIDAIYSGSLKRQQQTAGAVLDAFQQADKPLPEFITDPGFNELENERQIELLAPMLQEHDQQLRDLMKTAGHSKKNFQKVLKAVFNHWVLEQPEIDGLESWGDFSARVHQSLGSVMRKQGSGKTVLVATSGGVIATIVARVMNMPDSAVYSLFEPVQNASITRLLYNASGDISLSCFNDCGYLRAEQVLSARSDLISYR